MPTFFMSTLMIPKTVIKQINSYLMNCFWRKYGSMDRGIVLISWDKVSRPKNHGGIGFLNLHMHNKALLLKFLHKFFNKIDTPWVNIIWERHYQNRLPGEQKVGSFWWRYVLKLLPVFKQHAICKAGIGDSVYFWSDKWQELPLQTKFPELHSFAINQAISLHSVLEHNDISQLFHRTLSQLAFEQFNSLQTILKGQALSTNQDRWSYIWTSPKYSSMRMYKAMKGENTAHDIFRYL